jgi:hypothetical protein
LDAWLATLLCKEITVAIYKEVNIGWFNFQEYTSLAEFTKEGYVSERALIADDDDDG